VSKQSVEPGTHLYPVPAVMVSCADENTKANIITIAWTGVVSSQPPTVGIGVRPSRYSYDLIRESGEFVVNLPDDQLLAELDYCGVVSGRDLDKFSVTGLTQVSPDLLQSAPLIDECPVSLECEVVKRVSLKSHDYFIGRVVRTHVAKQWAGDDGSVVPLPEEMVSYASGTYYSLGRPMAEHGFSLKEQILADHE